MRAGAIFNRQTSAPSSTHIILVFLLAFTISFTSSLAWKVSDVDFAAKLGSEYLVKSYLLTAVALFIGALTLLTLRKNSPAQRIFFIFQKCSLLFFGSIAIADSLFHISQLSFVVFIFKVLGYAYSSLVIHSFWIYLDVYNKRSTVTTAQCTLYMFGTYLGMSTAGFLLQSSSVGASQFGVIGALCSLVCWFLGSIASEPHANDRQENTTPFAQTPPKLLFKAVLASRSVFLLVIGSVLLNVLVSSTECSVIADFESRFMTSPATTGNNQTIGSFVALIGVGNIFALFSSQLCLRFDLGRAGLSFVTVLAFLTLRCGFSDGHSLLISALALVVLESLYPLVVESNLARLLDFFPEQQRLFGRFFIETLIEPAGLIFSAGLLSMSWVNVCTLGVSIIVVSLLLTIFSYTIEGKWMIYFAHLRSKKYVLAPRLISLLVLILALIPYVSYTDDSVSDFWMHENEWNEPLI